MVPWTLLYLILAVMSSAAWIASLRHLTSSHGHPVMCLPATPQAFSTCDRINDVPEGAHAAQGDHTQPHRIWNPLLHVHELHL